MQNKLFIDGQWVAPADGAMLPVIDPATEEVFHHIAAAGAAEAEMAVKASREAFDNGPWPRLSGKERAKYLRAMAREIRDRLPELARMETRDNGKPLPESEWDLTDAAGCFDFYANLAEELDGEVEEVKLSDVRFVSKAVREPLGVAVAIVPWN
ncbi:aldehyde dehydrogenase family protein, partial [Sinorhizobium meliloti]